MDDVPVNQAEFHCDRFLRRLKNKSSMLKKVSLHLKRISSILIPKSSKLHRYVKKVIKLCNTRYKCNHKHDPKIFYVIKVTVPKKTYLLSFSSLFNHTYVIMKPKCNCTARRYLSLFSCNSQSRMTNYLNNPLRRRDSARSVSSRISLRWPIHIINPVDQTKLSCNTPTDAAPQFPEKLNPFPSRLYEFRLQAIDVGGAGHGRSQDFSMGGSH